MNVKYYNKKLLNKDRFQMVKSLVHFVSNKRLSKRMMNTLEINIHFHDDYMKKHSKYGDCIWEDQHYRPKEFTINVDVAQKDANILNTIAHELVHVKQWCKGEMYELQLKRKCYKFNGKEVNTKDMDYWDLPWEIEAHGRSVGLVVQWTRTLDINKKKRDNLIIDC